MKAYALTGSEMTELGGIGLASSLSFSVATFMFGFWLDISRDIAFAKGTPADALAYWQAIGDFAKYGTVVFAIIGVGLLVWAGFRVTKIMRDTVFDVPLRP